MQKIISYLILPYITVECLYI